MKRLFFLFLTVAACSSPSEDVGSNDAFDTIHPAGNDYPGTLVITVPSEAASLDTPIYVDGRPATPGTPVTDLAVGDHEVTVNAFRATVNVPGNTTTTYALGAFHLTMPTVRVLGLNHKDANGHPTGEVKFSDQGGYRITLAVPDELTPTTLTLAPPGAIHAQWGVGDGARFTTTAGRVTVDLEGHTDRRLVRLQAPERAFDNTNGSDSWAVWGRPADGSWGSIRVHVDDRSSLVVGMEGDGEIELATAVMGNDSTPVVISDVGGAAPLQHIARIDVDDVLLTTPQGRTKVKGSYTVTDANGRSFTGGTSTGADVWPGTFTVTTTYDTTSSGPQTNTQTITVR